MKTLIINAMFISFASIAFAAESSHVGYISKFTSLKDNKCKKLSCKQSSRFDNRQLERSECWAPKGWRLFTVIGGERAWLEIMYGKSLWSTEDEVVTKADNRFGHFQSVDFVRVEWIINKGGEVQALIFPVVAQDPEHYDQNLTRYFVIKLSNRTPEFCGVARSSNDARVLAGKPSVFHVPLPSKATNN